ncbi:MAG: acyltransferase [Phycisphaerales bacterium]|nr:acyltransferase [Phycisphaerales bacterium]
MLRAAMTQVCNAYPHMPATVDRLSSLADRLEEIRAANVDYHVSLIELAHQRGARVIGLGELFPAPYFALRRDDFWLGMAESATEGPTVSTMRRTAARLNMVIVAPIYERDGDQRFNTAVVIDADGSVLGRQRKCHIPQGSNERGSFVERHYYERADRPPYLQVFPSAVGPIGVAICYDRHFEGVMSGLARRGAKLIFSPAVTFGSKSRRMWDLEFRVDAARHNVFIGGSNRSGVEAPWNQPYFGASYFTGPNGVLRNLSEDERLVIADLDFEELDQPDPSGWHLVRDTRPELQQDGD